VQGISPSHFTFLLRQQSQALLTGWGCLLVDGSGWSLSWGMAALQCRLLSTKRCGTWLASVRRGWGIDCARGGEVNINSRETLGTAEQSEVIYKDSLSVRRSLSLSLML